VDELDFGGAELRAEVERLRIENARLHKLLELAPGATTPAAEQAILPVHRPGLVTNTSGKEQQLALYRELFRARTDVFARRWESPWNGDAGWSPAYNEPWHKGIDRRKSTWTPLTTAVFDAHLAGQPKSFLGLYPLLPNNTCFWLAADFDKDAAMLDALAYLKAARQAGVPAALEISQSGKGAHVWIFFSAPVEAAKARAMGTAIMHEAMKLRGTMNLTSYDRFFPSQDVLPGSGPGNLIGAPLNGQRAAQGLTVFLDPATLEPYPDQWEFLSTLDRMSPAAVARIARWTSNAVVGAEVTTVKPSKATKVHPRMSAIVHAELGAGLAVSMSDLTPEATSALKHAASMHNPRFYELVRLRRSTFDTPRFVQGYDLTLDGKLVIPRGLRYLIADIVQHAGSRLVIDDVREGGKEIDVALHVTLREEQAVAVEAMLGHDDGALVAPPGAGKTVMACAIIAERAVSTIILVNRKALAEQWRERIKTFLDFKPGQIGGGREKLTGIVDIAMLPALARRENAAELLAGYGQVIVDECHNVAAPAYDYAMKTVSAQYWLGLTATPKRRDGLQELITWQLGPIRHTIGEPERGTLQDAAAPSGVPIRTLTIHETAFDGGNVDPYDPIAVADLLQRTITDPGRNQQILGDIAAALKAGRNCLVATTRRDHVELLAEQLAARGFEPKVLVGGMKATERRAIVADLMEINNGDGALLIATTQFVGEGFDVPGLDTLFLVAPVSWESHLLQIAGRIVRTAEGKEKAEVHDYVDIKTPILARRLEKRMPGYLALGFAKQ